MKKILLASSLILLMTGCSKKEIEQYQVPVEEMTATQINDEELSKDMYDSVARVTQIFDGYTAHVVILNLKSRKKIKNDSALYLPIIDMKKELDNIQFDAITSVDDQFYDVMKSYQYNLSQCMNYMIKFAHDKDQPTLDMHMSYLADLKIDVQELKTLTTKYGIQ